MAEANTDDDDRETRKDELRQRLLSKAFAEHGEKGQKEMQARLNRMRETCEEIPAEHVNVLREVSQTPEGTARGVMMLNALARHEGVNKRFTDEEAGDNGPLPPPARPSGPTIH